MIREIIESTQVITTADIDLTLRKRLKDAKISIINMIDYLNKLDFTPKKLVASDYDELIVDYKDWE